MDTGQSLSTCQTATLIEPRRPAGSRSLTEVILRLTVVAGGGWLLVMAGVSRLMVVMAGVSRLMVVIAGVSRLMVVIAGVSRLMVVIFRSRVSGVLWVRSSKIIAPLQEPLKPLEELFTTRKERMHL